MKFNLFDNFKVNQEYKRIKNVINNAPKNITPEFIKTIPDFNTREKIYITYDSCSQEEFDNFFNLYKLDKDIAMKTLDFDIIIYSNETVNLIKNNLDKIKLLNSYGVDINFIFNSFKRIVEKIDKYYKLCTHYGEEVVQYLNNENISFLENDKITKLDSKFVLENINELKEIFGLSEKKFNCLLKLYKEKSDKYNFVKNFILNDNSYDDNIISFLETFQFDENVVDIIKINEIKEITFFKTKILDDIRLKRKFGIKITNGYERDKFMQQSINYLKNYFKNKSDIYNYKNLLLESISHGALKNNSEFAIIKEKYYSKLSEKNKMFLDTILNIIFTKSFVEVDKDIQLLNEKNFNINEFMSELRIVESKQFNDALFKPNLKSGYINEDGIRIIETNSIDINNFKMFVHSIGKSGNTEHNDNISEELLNNPSKWNKIEGGSDFMSLSLIADNKLATYGTDLVLGFDAENIEINSMSGSDSNTPMSAKISYNDFGSLIQSYTPENLIYDCMINSLKGITGSYNEISINRNKQMVPKYIVLKTHLTNTSGFSEYNDYVKKWAKYFDIPVVILDGRIIKKNALKGIKEKCNLIKEKGITYENFIDLLHSIDTVENIDSVFNYYEIFDFLLNLCENNYDNFVEFQKIINFIGKYLDKLLSKDVANGDTLSDNEKREKRKQDIIEFKKKFEYLKDKYNTKEVESEHKLGFVAINCVFLTLTVILIFTLIYILFKYLN